MKLDAYEEWLCGDRWDGHPLDEIILDTTPLTARDEYVDAINYKDGLRSLFILSSGLCGEAGEASEHFKKWIRDGKLNRVAAGIELGDVLAYLTWLAKTLGYSLEDIAEMNYEKLRNLPRKQTPRTPEIA